MDIKTARGARWVLGGFLVIAAYFLWSEHRAHVMGALPYLLLLACPVMHLFHHHHGHEHQSGHHSSHGHDEERRS